MTIPLSLNGYACLYRYYMVVNTFLVNTVLQASLLFYGAHLCLNGREGSRMHPKVLIAFMLYQGQLLE